MRLNLSELLKNEEGAILPISLFMITVITRIPFTSQFLYHMDSVHFALALKKYNITLHQPHPPGCFLYVMIGRFLNLFIKDANAVFVYISIVFSGLAVVAIYYAGKEIFGRKTGLLAALIALTSPNLWFHGEVALTYIVEAFFSATIAFLCWNILKGKNKYIWLSVVVLGIAGAIRPYTLIFLLPLWLFSVRGAPIRNVVASLGLLGFICILWFLPMVIMTGGLNAYLEASRELWLYTGSLINVFERGWSSFKLFSSYMFVFIIYGIGAGVFVLSIAIYSIIRQNRFYLLDWTKVSFFSLWILPSVSFYLLIGIGLAVPGHILIFLPSLIILVAASIGYISDEFKSIASRDLAPMITSGIIITNILFFFLSEHPVSYKCIKEHDKSLSIMLNDIKTFDSSKTAVFARPYIFYGLRHIMYYLPDYRVFDTDVSVSKEGKVRKTFWGLNMETYLTEEIVVPANIDTFVTPIFSDDKDRVSAMKGIAVRSLKSTDIFIASGDISGITDIYPEIKRKVLISK